MAYGDVLRGGHNTIVIKSIVTVHLYFMNSQVRRSSQGSSCKVQFPFLLYLHSLQLIYPWPDSNERLRVQGPIYLPTILQGCVNRHRGIRTPNLSLRR